MRIALLDADTINLGDTDLTPILRQGRCVTFRETKRDEILVRSRGATIVIVGSKLQWSDEEFSQLPRLKLLCVTATGVEHVDLAAARRRGIAVTNIARYSTATVAEQALLFILALGHRLPEHHRGATDGSWRGQANFALLDFPFSDIEGKILGIVGYGSIGQAVAKRARSFGIKVLVAKIPGRSYPPSADRVPLEKLLRQSDFISLHCPLTELTRQLMNKKRLSLMKPTTFLINLSRGAVVDEAALARALAAGRLAGYASDVLQPEPPPANHPLLRKNIRDKILLTPHIAWASRESRQRMVVEIAKNIRAFLKGERRNRVEST